MIETDILDAAMTILEGVRASYNVPVGYPNLFFTPPSEGLWMEVSFFPNSTETHGLKNDFNEHYGFIQVNVGSRLDKGIYPALDLANSVIAAYPFNTVLGPGRVRRKPTLSPSIKMDDKFLHPVTIYYRNLGA